ncbi:hypothetical protein G6F68_021067 [Rhizopus microsporus]|nr:hypothetical protein G6F68_021067 [Rhizopus microsporus]
MTLAALEVLKKRGGKDGFFMMSEAASVDKQLHIFDFPRAWADLIELDVTIKNTIQWLKVNADRFCKPVWVDIVCDIGKWRI